MALYIIVVNVIAYYLLYKGCTKLWRKAAEVNPEVKSLAAQGAVALIGKAARHMMK